MIRRLDPRTVAGGVLTAIGIGAIGAALLLSGPTHANAAAFVPTKVWLTIQLSDSAQHDFQPGGSVTYIATVANSSTTTTLTSSGVSSVVTANGVAHPTITFSLSTGEVSFVSAGGGYACSDLSGNGQPTCTKTANSGGSLSPGGTDTPTVVVTVVGKPGDQAGALATVSPNGQETNLDTASATAFDSGFIGGNADYTNQAPSGCFARKVGSDREVTNQPVIAAAQPRVASGSQIFTFQDGTVTITVIVPPGALPNGTILSLYGGDPTCWNADVTSATASHTERDAYAVGWALSGNSSFTASSSIEISVSDTGVHSGDPLFGTNKSGLGPVIGTASASNWTAVFTADPGFVLAQAAAAAPSSSSSAAATITAPPSGGGPVTRQTSPVPLALGVLAIVGGAGLIGTRRRRRPE